MSVLKSDVSGLKSDVSGLKTNVFQLASGGIIIAVLIVVLLAKDARDMEERMDKKSQDMEERMDQKALALEERMNGRMLFMFVVTSFISVLALFKSK